jgi:hypothetical protein
MAMRSSPHLLPVSSTRTSFSRAGRPARPPARALFAIAALALLGCGHPATQAECDEIFNRSAEIELRMQNVTDPKLIQERTAAVRAAKGEELIRKCVGKRVTDSAMECVRKATTAEQMDQCLD